eukprot:GAHX01004324.1.p2 GENE.GAHX01004324.1~~GAHX01004324.1.p2  ORF type:complete len:56 (+),score=2.37 GAHX01004324.1:70-237(+)
MVGTSSHEAGPLCKLKVWGGALSCSGLSLVVGSSSHEAGGFCKLKVWGGNLSCSG